MKPESHKPGFTLIEVLVTIGIIAILVGILVPVVGKSINRSRELTSAVNLRSIGQLFEMYAGASAGVYPAPVPGRLYPSFSPQIQSTIPHWLAVDNWPGLFGDTHPWWQNERLYLAPGAERDYDGLVISFPKPSFDYAASFLGNPSIWTDRSITADEWPRLERSVTQQMVRFPAGKVLMWDREMPYLRLPPRVDADYNLLEKTPMLFADQHVAARVPAEGSDPVFNRATGAQRPGQRLHNTRDGVQGRDY